MIQPGKTDNGCSTCPDRIGGGYGGNWEGSGPFERVDGGEIIEGLQRVAITCGRPAILILLVNFLRQMTECVSFGLVVDWFN